MKGTFRIEGVLQSCVLAVVFGLVYEVGVGRGLNFTKENRTTIDNKTEEIEYDHRIYGMLDFKNPPRDGNISLAMRRHLLQNRPSTYNIYGEIFKVGSPVPNRNILDMCFKGFGFDNCVVIEPGPKLPPVRLSISTEDVSFNRFNFFNLCN